MLKMRKKSFIIINTILCFLFTFLLLNLVLFKQTSYLFCILSLIIPLGLIILIYGYERKKRRYMYESIFYIFAYGIFFLLFTYILGIFIGFTTNVYKIDINNLIHNILPYTILIIVCELFRYEIIRKGDGSPLSYVLICLILILIDMTLFYTTYDLSNGDAQIKYICSIVLPSVFKNAILLYFSKIGGPIPTIVYRIIFDLKLVILPIFPDFGLYFESIINCIFPAVLFIIVEFILRKDENKNETVNVHKRFLFRYLIIAVLFVLVIAFNILSSGYFKYSLKAIGSGSMAPKIEKGDVVFYKKIDENYTLKIDDILVFHKENKTIVHRIIEIQDGGNGEKVYFTKGDANESPDGYPITQKDIEGVVVFRIKYIGIPSVILGETIN